MATAIVSKNLRSRLEKVEDRRFLIGIFVFVMLFLYAAVWIWQGLDVTDSGYDLTNQVTALCCGDYYEYERLTWLSDVLGGLWLAIVPFPSVLWARIGWAMLVGLTGLVSYLVVASYYSNWKAAVATLAAALALIFYSKLVIDYNNVPALLLIGGAGLLLATQRVSVSGSHSIAIAFFAGILLGLAILARLPFLLSIFIPFIAPGVATIHKRSFQKQLWRRGFVALGGIAIGLVIGAVILYSTGQLGNYLAGASRSVVNSPDDEHLLADLIVIYGRELGASIWRGALMVLAGGLVATLLMRLRLVDIRSGYRQLSFALFIVLLFILLRGYFILLPGISIVIAVFAIVIGFLARPVTDERVDKLVLVIVAGYIAFLSFFGSAAGILSMRYASWLLLPATFLLLPESLEAMSHRLARGYNPTIAGYVLFGLIALGVVGLMYQFSGPYRDSANRLTLTSEIGVQSLQGIRTTASRAASLEQLLDEIGGYVGPGDRLLAYNSIPLVYYVTETIPGLRHPWPTHLSTAEVEARLGKMEEVPVAVRATTNTRHPDWGGRSVPEIEYQLLDDNLRLLDGWLEANGYLKTWSNGDFEIYVLKDA